MIKQSFSEKNLRKIFDLENRKGNNLEKIYFENVAAISEQIKQNKKNIKNILRLSKQDLTRGDQISRVNEERKILKEKRDILLSTELEKISKEIISDSFICEIQKQNIKDKDVYTIDTSNASTFFLLKQIQYNLKYIFKIKQSNVNFLLSQLKISLSNRFPKIIFKIDISSFYESIPRDKVILQLIDDPKLSLQTRKTIKYIFDTFSKNNPEVQGFPRGIGLSAYLSEYYMKDFDEFFRTHSDCSFYARYVDDIILIFNPSLNTVKNDYEALIKETLKTKGLELNQKKKKIININDSNAHFDYLGYVFNIEGSQLHSIKLRNSRIISYRNKIALCFISYLRQLKKAPNKAAKTLENRLRYLTSNTRLIHNKQNVMVGIYFSNKLITDMKQLEDLDSFLLKQIETDITDEILKIKLSSYSFKNGFLNKEYIKFPKKFIKEIQRMTSLAFLEKVTPPIPPMLYHFHPVAFVEFMQTTETKIAQIIFPLKVKPSNDKEGRLKSYYWAAKLIDSNASQAIFGRNRSGGARKHAARDLYTDPLAEVVAVCDGIVLQVSGFYCKTDQVTVLHNTKDNRKFIVRYGELDPSSIKVKKDVQVKQGQTLGKTGKLLNGDNSPLMKIGSEIIYMLHFEYFTGSTDFDLTSPLTNRNNTPYQRREDLTDPLKILQEGYKNTFEQGLQQQAGDKNFSLEDGKLALRVIYDRYGKDMAIIIERMYRDETRHFTSQQYVHCGAGGMESFGDAPYYGWDSSLFTEKPVGTWSAFENKGMSGQGGNSQVTDKKKVFVVFPSVLAAMEFKVNYINKYNGNYARWHSTNSTIQSNYKAYLEKITPKFSNEFEASKK